MENQVSLQHEDVPIFLVGTRFQAVMANAIVEYLELTKFDLVFFHHDDTGKVKTDLALTHLASRARRVTPVNRLIRERRQTAELIRAIGRLRRTVFAAQISAEFVMTIFPFRKKLCLQTFDEGSFNIVKDGPFFQPERFAIRSLRDVMLRLKFPDGIIAFARNRSQRHFTAFAPALNLMSNIAERVPVAWHRYLEDGEQELVRDARSIMVLPCFQDFSGTAAERKRIWDYADKCDLVVRHPRDAALADIDTICLKAPVEAAIDMARASGPVRVYHFASTVGLTIADWDDVTVFDLSKE